MTGIVGIGGVFFKSDVKATQDWYARVLGVRFSDWGSAEFPSASAGQTVLGPFSADTDYFAPSTQPFMINLLGRHGRHDCADRNGRRAAIGPPGRELWPLHLVDGPQRHQTRTLGAGRGRGTTGLKQFHSVCVRNAGGRCPRCGLTFRT
jgi:hypothetical protein